MAPSRWKVEHNCPQCGGPVALTEDERVLTCHYCRVKLFVANGGGPLRYCLPPRHADVGSIVMVPYWRVRGQVFREENLHLSARVLDDTRLASPAPDLAPTLGIRPQAMSLRFLSAEFGDRFIAPTVEPRFAAARTTRTPNARLIGDAAFELSLVPARSLVYLPVRLAGGVFDATASRRLGGLSADDWLPLAGPLDAAPPTLTFLPTLCPWCSWQLDCHPDSLVFTCGLCRRAYRTTNAALQEVPYQIAASRETVPVAHAPFWRVDADISGIDLRSWTDFVRFGNLPLVPRPGWERDPVQFWVPAFATSPDQFLRFARTMTMAAIDTAPAGHQHEGKPMAEPWAVSTPVSCLANAVKVLLAEFGQPKVTLFPRLNDVGVTITRVDLVYVPLADGGVELVHRESQLVIARSAARPARAGDD